MCMIQSTEQYVLVLLSVCLSVSFFQFHFFFMSIMTVTGNKVINKRYRVISSPACSILRFTLLVTVKDLTRKFVTKAWSEVRSISGRAIVQAK